MRLRQVASKGWSFRCCFQSCLLGRTKTPAAPTIGKFWRCGNDNRCETKRPGVERWHLGTQQVTHGVALCTRAMRTGNVHPDSWRMKVTIGAPFFRLPGLSEVRKASDLPGNGHLKAKSAHTALAVKACLLGCKQPLNAGATQFFFAPSPYSVGVFVCFRRFLGVRA